MHKEITLAEQLLKSYHEIRAHEKIAMADIEFSLNGQNTPSETSYEPYHTVTRILGENGRERYILKPAGLLRDAQYTRQLCRLILDELSSAMDSLNYFERRVIKLLYIEKLSWEAAETRLSISESTLRRNRLSALQKIDALLKHKLKF